MAILSDETMCLDQKDHVIKEVSGETRGKQIVRKWIETARKIFLLPKSRDLETCVFRKINRLAPVSQNFLPKVLSVTSISP